MKAAEPESTLPGDTIPVELPEHSLDTLVAMRSWFAISQRWAVPISICLVATATVTRVALDPFVNGAQYVFFYLAIIVSTSLGGVAVGLLTVPMSIVSTWYFIVKPSFSFALHSADVPALVLFTLIASLMVVIIGSLQRAVGYVETEHHRAVILEERVRTADELQRWKDIFDNLAMGVVVNMPGSAGISFANPMYAEMHGMSPEQVIGTPVAERYAPAERDRLIPLAVLCDKVGHVSFEADRVRADGSIFPARIHVTSVRGPQGNVLYRIGSMVDITKEREQQMQWKDIFDNIGIGVSVADPASSTLRLANKTYAQMHGWPQEELVGMPYVNLLPTHDASCVAGLMAVADRDGNSSGETERLRKDGSCFPARLQTTTVRGTDGALRYRIATVTDITAERARETRWQNVIDNATFGITLNEPETNVIGLLNRTFAEMHGYSPDEIMGKSFFDYYAPAERKRVAGLRKIADRDGFVNFEADRLRRDGSMFPARMHVTSVRGSQGESLYRIVSMFDITSEREQQLRHEAELRRWTDVINNSAFGISVVDPRTDTISTGNPAFAALHGLTGGQSGRPLDTDLVSCV